MSKTVCPQCLMSNDIDCREAECPGRAGFRPASWQRPLIQISADLERYESLLMQCAGYFNEKDATHSLCLRLNREVQVIRAKQKKEGAGDVVVIGDQPKIGKPIIQAAISNTLEGRGDD